MPIFIEPHPHYCPITATKPATRQSISQQFTNNTFLSARTCNSGRETNPQVSANNVFGCYVFHSRFTIRPFTVTCEAQSRVSQTERLYMTRAPFFSDFIKNICYWRETVQNGFVWNFLRCSGSHNQLSRPFAAAHEFLQMRLTAILIYISDYFAKARTLSSTLHKFHNLTSPIFTSL